MQGDERDREQYDEENLAPTLEKEDGAWHRGLLLGLLVLFAVGGHFVRASMTSLQPALLETFHIDSTHFGVLVSAMNLPALVAPVIGGAMLDSFGQPSLLLFMVPLCMGQLVRSLSLPSFDPHLISPRNLFSRMKPCHPCT
jgi:MFS family permease